MDCSLPGSSVRGISQARILEWVACPPPGDLPNPGMKPGPLHWQADSFLLSLQGNQVNHTPIKKKKEQAEAEMLPVGLEEAKCHVVERTMWLTMSSDPWEMGASALQMQETKFC